MKNAFSLFALFISFLAMNSAQAQSYTVYTTCLATGINTTFEELEIKAEACCRAPSKSTGLPAGRALSNDEARRMRWEGISWNNWSAEAPKYSAQDRASMEAWMKHLSSVSRQVAVTCVRMKQ